MAMTVNNLGTLHLLNILSRTTMAQENVFNRMSTGSKINRGADDPAGMLALTSLDSELRAVNAGISNNQRTDSILGVADGALTEVSKLLGEVQRLAFESANDAGLTADEVAANQAQIDDALASIDRIIGSTQFNGTKLLDGSLAINADVGTPGAVTDVRVYTRRPGQNDTTLNVTLTTAASAAGVSGVVLAGGLTKDSTLSIQGKLGTAVIQIGSADTVSAIAAKINASKAQTGLSADNGGSGGSLRIFSASKGERSFVRTKLLDGDSARVRNKSDTGVDAVVTVNGQVTGVDGDYVVYTGNGTSLSFNIGTLAAGSSVDIIVRGEGAGGPSGATYNLGSRSDTRATLGFDGMYTYQLGDAVNGYLSTIKSGGANSLVNDPSKAADIARTASQQVATLRGRIGGFQKFQVQTSLKSLQDTKEGLEKVRSVINDVDYAAETAELNRVNVLMQTALSLLGVSNQQTGQVLQLLR